MVDDIESTVRAAFDKIESPADAPPSSGDAAPPSESVPGDKAASEPSEGERARDEKGRFAAKPAAQENQQSTPPETVTGSPQQAPIATQPQQTSAQRIAPPMGWKGAGKTVWDKLPAAVQKELADDYAARAKTDEELNGFRSVITPERAQAFAAQYGGTPQAIKQLLAISDYATKNPLEFIQWYAKQNRIDLTSLTGQPGATGEQTPPQAQHPHEREIAELRSTVQQMRQEAQQRQLDAVMAEVNAFKADPEHPYYNDVEQHIIALLPTIPGSTRERLQKAYDQAVWANPQVRQAMIAAERERALKQNADTVSQARKAAGLNGSPAGAKVSGAGEPRLSLEDTVRQAADRVLQ